MKAPLRSLFTYSLISKVVAMHDRVAERNYRAVLEVACMVDNLKGVAAEVANYRALHGVSDEMHQRLLEEVPQCRHRPFRDPVFNAALRDATASASSVEPAARAGRNSLGSNSSQKFLDRLSG